MNKRILVIDDDPHGTRLLEYILEQRGYQVLVAENGLDGLEKALNEGPDLVVLNVMLPGMDGFEVCRRLRTEDKTARLPILILSGRAQQRDKAMGLKMGADDYLTKPATPVEIIDRVEMLLSRKNARRSKIAAFLSPKGKSGTGTTVANLAIALTQASKRVIAVDICPSADSLSQQLGVGGKTGASILDLPIKNMPTGELESALVTHRTGVRVLQVPQDAPKTGNLPENIDLLFDKLGELTDHFLVDIPFLPTLLTRTMLAKCDLAVIASDFTTEALSAAKAVITTLDFMGIPSEQTAAVIIDFDGRFPELSTSAIRPFVEANLGISLLGAVPHHVIPAQTPVDGVPVILSNPNSPLAFAAKEMARHLIARWETLKYSPELVVKKT